MPIYEYRCKEHGDFEEFSRMSDYDKKRKCPKCGVIATKLISCPNLQTDTNFFATGQYDNRVCDNYDDKIEGRKDWQRRLDKKGLRELDWAEAHKKAPVSAPCM